MHRSNSFVGQMAQVLRTPHQRCGGDQTAKTRRMLFSSFLIPSEKRPRNAIRENELRVSLDGRKSTVTVTDIREEEADRPRPMGASSRQVLSPLPPGPQPPPARSSAPLRGWEHPSFSPHPGLSAQAPGLCSPFPLPQREGAAGLTLPSPTSAEPGSPWQRVTVPSRSASLSGSPSGFPPPHCQHI